MTAIKPFRAELRRWHKEPAQEGLGYLVIGDVGWSSRFQTGVIVKETHNAPFNTTEVETLMWRYLLNGAEEPR